MALIIPTLSFFYVSLPLSVCGSELRSPGDMLAMNYFIQSVVRLRLKEKSVYTSSKCLTRFGTGLPSLRGVRSNEMRTAAHMFGQQSLRKKFKHLTRDTQAPLSTLEGCDGGDFKRRPMVRQALYTNTDNVEATPPFLSK